MKKGHFICKKDTFWKKATFFEKKAPNISPLLFNPFSKCFTSK